MSRSNESIETAHESRSETTGIGSEIWAKAHGEISESVKRMETVLPILQKMGNHPSHSQSNEMHLNAPQGEDRTAKAIRMEIEQWKNGLATLNTEGPNATLPMVVYAGMETEGGANEISERAVQIEVIRLKLSWLMRELEMAEGRIHTIEVGIAQTINEFKSLSAEMGQALETLDRLKNKISKGQSLTMEECKMVTEKDAIIKRARSRHPLLKSNFIRLTEELLQIHPTSKLLSAHEVKSLMSMFS